MNAGILNLWMVWDYIYQHITRLEYVDKESGNIFRVVFCKYRGPSLLTSDGVEINHGDPIVKLHIHNIRLAKQLKGIHNEARLGIKTLRLVKHSLPELAAFVESHPKGESVKGIIGTTFLHRGVNKLGFDVANVPDFIWYRFKNKYLKFMLLLIHPNGVKRLKEKPGELMMKRVYMSKRNLFSRYTAMDLKLEEEA